MKFLFSLAPLILGLILYRNSYIFYPWVSNYLPDGLWAFSFSSSLFLVLEHKKYLINLIIVIGFGITFEFMQWANVIKGTFDIVDIAIYIVANMMAIGSNKIISKVD